MCDTAKYIEYLDDAWKLRGKGEYKKVKALLQRVENGCHPDDFVVMGRVHHIYAQIERDHGNLKKALELYQKSLGIYQKSNIPEKIAHSMRHVADVQSGLGFLLESEQNFKSVIAIYRDTSDVRVLDLANALNGFGKCLEKLGKTREAIKILTEANQYYSDLDIRGGIEETNKKLSELQGDQ